MIGSDARSEERKACVEGTHRTRLPRQTLSWIEPAFEEVGITRIADVTWLDEIGIPVYQAIRPDSWSLCVSQGKGLTPDLAKVSAAMESIELWHAERMNAPQRTATPHDLTDELPYRLDELALARRNAVHAGSRLDWSAATGVRTGTRTWVPTELVSRDTRVGARWSMPLFAKSTNGLASGNTLNEALLHGLYEVIERDALTRAATTTEPPPALDLRTITGPATSLIDRMRQADIDLRVTLLPSPVGPPCFRANIWSDALPLVFDGSGCHTDREVALCRALTEAAQSRLTLIAGTRDDIRESHYRQAARAARLSGSALPTADDERLAFTDVPTTWQPDLAEDLHTTARQVEAVTGREPLYVDHTRPDLGIPVATVVCPGLRFDPAA